MNRNWIVVIVLLGFLCIKNVQANVIQKHIIKCYEEFGPSDDENWDKCLTEVNKLKYAGPNNMQSFVENRCFCDDNCSEYSDCCSDMKNPENFPWMCRPLNCRSKSVPVNIYMHQKCQRDWNDKMVKNLCEYELSYLFQETGNYHHLQEIPVFSVQTKIIYRNVFCAMCNRDTDLEKWTVDYKCNDTTTPEDLRNLVFEPNSKLWILNNGKITKCKIIIKELEDWADVINIYKARRCRGISQCAPTWNVAEDRLKCQSSDEIQYIFYHIEDNMTYKNIDCATCNYINITSLTCKPKDYALTKFGVSADYQLILDFNFAGDSEISCDRNQLYDPVLETCLDLSCGKLYDKIKDQCAHKTNNTRDSKHLNSDCIKVILNKDYLVILENETVYINHTTKYYSVEQYEPVFINGELKQILICAEEVISFNFSVLQAWISEIGLVISICCLIVHLVIYVILPKLHNLPGKIMICLSSSLLSAQLFFLIGSHCDSMTVTCRVIGIITHFSYLAAFFWMNVMALDIFRTFCSSISRSLHSKIFIKYSAYSWISSISIMVIALIMNYALPDSIYSPHYGENTCWISKKRALLIYFALPVAVILVMNTILFILTSLSLTKTAQETKMANKFSDKTRFILYVKIGLILGLTWIFGFIATLTKISFMWYPFIILNSLQGAYIFLSFTLKRKTWKHLKRKFQLKEEKKPTRPGYMRQCTSTSNLSTIQTTISSTLSASVPVLCNQKDIVNAIVNGKLHPKK